MQRSGTISTWNRNPADEEAMGAAHTPIWRHMIDVSVSDDLRDATVLDYGCNQGGFLRMLYDRHPFRAGVGIDIAPVAPGQHSSEHAVSVAMQDSAGPYDYHLSRHLLHLASANELPVRRDLFRYYFSDAHSAVTAGHDIRTALLAFGCDATHGYERTHIDSLAALSRLLGAYILSPPVFASDAQPAKGSLDRFSHQIEHDAQMESETRVPSVDSLVGQRSTD